MEANIPSGLNVSYPESAMSLKDRKQFSGACCPTIMESPGRARLCDQALPLCNRDRVLRSPHVRQGRLTAEPSGRKVPTGVEPRIPKVSRGSSPV